MTSIDLHVLQGERELVKDNRSLARFKLPIAPQPAGVPRIEVTFLIDANGILSVTAIDAQTGREHTIEVKPSYGLTDDEVEKMLIESFDYAEQDVTTRLLIESRIEADSLLLFSTKALREASELVKPDERVTIEAAQDRVRAAMPGDDRQAIVEATQALDAATRPLALELINRSVKQLIHGRTVSDVESIGRNRNV